MMNLEEAVSYLVQAEIKAWAYPGTKWPIRGGNRLTPLALEKRQRIVENAFRIEREKHLWLVTIFGPMLT